MVFGFVQYSIPYTVYTLYIYKRFLSIFFFFTKWKNKPKNLRLVKDNIFSIFNKSHKKTKANTELCVFAKAWHYLVSNKYTVFELKLQWPAVLVSVLSVHLKIN